MQFNLLDSGLGKQTNYDFTYNPSLLFRIPRSENREKYNIEACNLPFTGYDVWNCYEVSFLTLNGLPVSCMLKIIVPAHSAYIVESKSLKLYLFSFNMLRFEQTVAASTDKVLGIIRNDLEALLEVKIELAFMNDSTQEGAVFEADDFCDILNLLPGGKAETYSFTHFKEMPELLKSVPSEVDKTFRFRCDMLRSNCRVTNQPDWGELFVHIRCKQQIDLMSVLAYIVSFREENHFHEEVVEMIFTRMNDRFLPSELMVAATYTRRGGIDINPVRATDPRLIDKNLINPQIRLKKTYRQ